MVRKRGGEILVLDGCLHFFVLVGLGGDPLGSSRLLYFLVIPSAMLYRKSDLTLMQLAQLFRYPVALQATLFLPRAH